MSRARLIVYEGQVEISDLLQRVGQVSVRLCHMRVQQYAPAPHSHDSLHPLSPTLAWVARPLAGNRDSNSACHVRHDLGREHAAGYGSSNPPVVKGNALLVFAKLVVHGSDQQQHIRPGRTQREDLRDIQYEYSWPAKPTASQQSDPHLRTGQLRRRRVAHAPGARPSGARKDRKGPP